MVVEEETDQRLSKENDQQLVLLDSNRSDREEKEDRTADCHAVQVESQNENESQRENEKVEQPKMNEKH